MKKYLRLLTIGFVSFVATFCTPIGSQSSFAQVGDDDPDLILRVHGEDGSVFGDGSGWADDAFLHIQDALAGAEAYLEVNQTHKVEIWVAGDNEADGITYVPKAGDDPYILPNCSVAETEDCYTFYFVNNVKVLGGYAGDPNNDALRDHETYLSVLSGEAFGKTCYTDPPPTRCEDALSFHVVTCDDSSVTDTAQYDGFTIQDGEADGELGDIETTRGAGVFVKAGSPVLSNCIITNNKASGSGGGIAVTDNGGLTVRNCVIRGNESQTGSGGGIYYTGLAGQGSLLNTVVENNTADIDGGGIFANGINVVSCLVRDNVATQGSGGGMRYSSTPGTQFVNTQVTGNTAGTDGGGIATGQMIAINLTVADNSAGDDGGGIYFTSVISPSTAESLPEDIPDESILTSGHTPAHSHLTNCILWGNTVGSLATSNQLHVDFGREVDIDYSDVEGGELDITGGPVTYGMNNIDADPLFKDAANGNYRLTCNRETEVRSPCIGSGDMTAVECDVHDVDEDGRTVTQATPDLDLQRRVRRDSAQANDVKNVDQGAYEGRTAVEVVCQGDTDGDGDVDVDDLGAVFVNWDCTVDPEAGEFCGGADVHGAFGGCLNGTVDVDDFGAVFVNWDNDCVEPCPPVPPSVAVTSDEKPEWYVQCDYECELADADGVQDYDECMFDCAKEYVESQQDP